MKYLQYNYDSWQIHYHEEKLENQLFWYLYDSLNIKVSTNLNRGLSEYLSNQLNIKLSDILYWILYKKYEIFSIQ